MLSIPTTAADQHPGAELAQPSPPVAGPHHLPEQVMQVGHGITLPGVEIPQILGRHPDAIKGALRGAHPHLDCLHPFPENGCDAGWEDKHDATTGEVVLPAGSAGPDERAADARRHDRTVNGGSSLVLALPSRQLDGSPPVAWPLHVRHPVSAGRCATGLLTSLGRLVAVGVLTRRQGPPCYSNAAWQDNRNPPCASTRFPSVRNGPAWRGACTPLNHPIRGTGLHGHARRRHPCDGASHPWTSTP